MVSCIGSVVVGVVELAKVTEGEAYSRKRVAGGDCRFERLLRGLEEVDFDVFVVFVAPRVFVPPRARHQRGERWNCTGLYADHVWRNVSEVNSAFPI